LILVGYSSYTMLYIRANQDPAINENDPSTPARFVSYLEREQYGSHSILDRRSVWMESRQDPNAYKADQVNSPLEFLWEYQIKYMYLRYFGWQFLGKTDFFNPQHNEMVDVAQFWFLPFLLGLFGMIYHFQRDNRRALILLTLLLMTGLAVIGYLNQPDPQPRERDYSYVGSFMAFSLWIGLGASGLLELVQEALEKRKQRLTNWISYGLIGLLTLAVPVQMLAKNYHSHDRSGNYVAWDYSYNLFQTLEPNSIVFTNGDNDTFPLWYLQEVVGVRKDVKVVNLSLLNTHWYIKQLRDYEPRILPASLRDETINQMYPMQFKAQNVEISVPKSEQNPRGNIRFRLEPTYQGQGIRVQDLMILRILQENLGERPVYFAITVSQNNKVNLEDFLRMDGLAQRVMPYNLEDPIEPDIISDNLFHVYQYRNLDNPDVYLNNDIRNLLQNYRSCFMQLAMHYYQRGNMDSTRVVLDRMHTAVPEEMVPFTNQDIYLQIGQLYAEAGEPEILRTRLDEVLQRPNINYQRKLSYGWLYASVLDDYAKADSIFTQIYNQHPNNGQVVGGLLHIYESQSQWQKAYNLINRWLQNNPGDQSARELLQKYESRIEQSAADTSGG
ncbi:MAG TPA: tetratricopeptide repeat protein, partial [bacterium]|nr:tetratricopeptide repeat protein [bacterium]